jgi:lipoprotein signal peptidase
MIERLAYGHVTDFIKLGHWYNFNVADASVVAGGLLMVY